MHDGRATALSIFAAALFVLSPAAGWSRTSSALHQLPPVSAAGASIVTVGNDQLPAVQLTGTVDRGRLRGSQFQGRLTMLPQFAGEMGGTFTLSDGEGNLINGILIGLFNPNGDGPGGGCLKGIFAITGGQGIFSNLNGSGAVHIDWPQGLDGPFTVSLSHKQQRMNFPAAAVAGDSLVTGANDQLPAVQLNGTVDRGRLRGSQFQGRLTMLPQFAGELGGAFTLSDGEGNLINGILIGLFKPEEDRPGGGCLQGIFAITGGQGIFSNLNGSGPAEIDWPQGLNGPFTASINRSEQPGGD